jgi:hypothetical protein
MNERDSSALHEVHVAPEPARSAEHLLARLELPDAANELLAMVRFLTAPDGPLQQFAETGISSPWHERVLGKAQERLEALDTFLRGRVAFFVAGRTSGYGVMEAELDVAGAALDASRAITVVVDKLLDEQLPTGREFDRMSEATNKIFEALERL